MAEEQKEATSESTSEKDLASLSDIAKFKEASMEDKEAFLKQVEEGKIQTEQDKETSNESEEEPSKEQKESSKEELPSEEKEEVDKSTSDISQSEKESTETDQEKDTSLENQFAKLKKSYDSLQSEFTRRSQKNKKLENELDDLRREVQRNNDQLNVKTSEFDQMMEQIGEKNPDAARLFRMAKEAAVKEAKAEFDKELQTLKSDMSKVTFDDNLRGFQADLDGFLKSDLGELEPQLLDIINEQFSDRDALLEAASKDPLLWSRLRKELLAKHFEKAAELKAAKSSRKPKKEVSNEDRDKEIQEAKGAGKARTSKKETDPDSIEAFRKLSNKDKEKFLKKRGLFI